MGCFGCLKVILIIFAVGYLLVGLGLLAVALWLRFDYLKDAAEALSFQQTDFMTIALYIAMGIGAFLVLLGIMGCVGAMRISLCLLGNFAVLLVAAIGGLIAVCVLAYIYQDQIMQGAVNLMANFMRQYGQPMSHAAVDAIQRTFRCCGSQFPTDWVTMAAKPVPASCCINTNACFFGGNVPYNFPSNTVPVALNNAFGNNPNLVNVPLAAPQAASYTMADIMGHLGDIFQQGCADKLRNNYRQAMQIIVGLAGGIAGFMLLGFVMCIAFCCVM